MNSVHNAENSTLEPRYMMVAMMWSDYHPQEIAEAINTRFSLYGIWAWTERHVWNARQSMRDLDMGARTAR